MALSNAERQRRYRLRKKLEGAAGRDADNGRNAGNAVTVQPMDWRDPQAVLSFLESLPRVFAHADGPYTYVDRARDFAAVFNGTSGMEQGRRVFAQIAQICDPTSAPADANQHGTLAFKAGARWVMAQISMCFVVKEPLRVERAPQQTER